ncbi:helix-turn-helix domain-containing protein [Streptomyces sp. NRRL F-5630]|uniref:helix-turn-helix domain-containing protein n=1 Tax=Streptomyces sp. NRRL F-5630 TaxID=1463864 RepID=UPI003D7141C2
MTDEKRRARPAVQYGPTAATVAANAVRLRTARGLSIYSLSALLDKAGRPIAPSAIAKLEKQQRQVTVDDLVALAVVFGVSPSSLLLPLTREGAVEVTGAGRVPAITAWEWADGERPLLIPHDDKGQALLEFRLWGRPPALSGAPLSSAERRLFNTVEGRRSFADGMEASGREVERYPDGTVRSWREPGGAWVKPLPHVEEGGPDGTGMD